jgi:TolB-like protein/predicted Zn-dependent protease
MADIFISYARPDRARIERLAAALESQGFSVWWDRQIEGGAEFAKSIEVELGAATAVIVAWSEHSLDSHWVRDEADFAREANKLLPLLLDGVLPPLGSRQLHTIDFSNWDETTGHPAFGELIQSVGAAVRSNIQQAATEREAVAKPVWRKPCLAVLPFANMSTDEEVEFIADGLTEDLITLLSSNKHLSVPARTSVFAFKGQSVDIRGVGETLGARYIVEGSIRKIGKRARVTVQLIEAVSGEHVWAKKFDLGFDELVESSDSIVEKISGSLFAQLTWAEADRSERAPTETLGAWEYCQRAAARIGRAVGSVKTMRQCISELQQALVIAPDYALAHALLSWSCNAAIINGIYEDQELEFYIEGAKAHLRRARELAQEDLLTLTYIGASENFAGMQERALQTLEQVLARNPASAETWYIICQVYAYLGRFDDARQAIDRASALAPEAGFAPLHAWYRGLADFLAGEYSVATPALERKALEQPDYGYVNILSAICEDIFGNQEAAQKYIAKAKQHNPQLRPEKVAGMILTQFDKEKGKSEYARLEKLWSVGSP